MAKAFKCDLCGELFEGEPVKEVSAPVVTGLQMIASLQVGSRSLDLCPSCVLKLREALHKGFDLALPEEKRKILNFQVEALLREIAETQAE